MQLLIKTFRILRPSHAVSRASSRPTLVRLLERGEIPMFKPGRHSGRTVAGPPYLPYTMTRACRDWPVRGGRRPARRADHDDFRFPATNVLFGAVLADTLLRIAEAGAYRPHWSPDVLAELSRNWVLRAREERIEGRRFRT